MSLEEERRYNKQSHQSLHDLKDLGCETTRRGKSGVVQEQSGQGVDMICGRRADHRIRHHRPAYPVEAAAMAMVGEAAGVIINSTLEGG